MKLLVLATHFDNQPEVLRFAVHLLEITRMAGVSCRLIVTDNSGNWDNSVPSPAGMQIVNPGSNRGYLNGCLFAFESGVNTEYADWIAVANTDLSFDCEFFSRLSSGHWPWAVGIIAPRITRDDGREQNPYLRHRPSPARMIAYTFLYRSVWGLRLLNVLDRLRWSPSGMNPTRSYPIYAPHGALVLLRNSFFQLGGKLGYPAFMYGEEIHLAEQIRTLGLQVIYAPELRVWHHAGAVTSRSAVEQRCTWKLESARYLCRAYFS